MTNMTKMTLLYNGWKVPTVFYDKIYEKTKVGVGAIKRDRLYKVEDLAAPGFWNILSIKSNKCLAGRCFIDMVYKKRFRQRLKCVRKGRLKTNFFVIV